MSVLEIKDLHVEIEGKKNSQRGESHSENGRGRSYYGPKWNREVHLVCSNYGQS